MSHIPQAIIELREELKEAEVRTEKIRKAIEALTDIEATPLAGKEPETVTKPPEESIDPPVPTKRVLDSKCEHPNQNPHDIVYDGKCSDCRGNNEKPKKPIELTVEKLKGVSKKKNSTNYRAQYWSKDERTVKHLGSFNNPYRAAAEVQKAKGNTEAAQEYFNLAELWESDPDKPPEPAYRKIIAWECNKCGRRHEGCRRPGKCENCGKGSFTSIRAKAKGLSDHERSAV